MPKDAEPWIATELATQEAWDAMLASKDINIVDVYASWCGPCMCLSQHWKAQFFDEENQRILEEAEAQEGKGVKLWTACAEKLTEDEAMIEALEDRKGASRAGGGAVKGQGRAAAEHARVARRPSRATLQVLLEG
jgi:thiol-disulfide isomerase/thioredoxin